RRGAADARRLRLRQGVPRRAPLARGASLQDRAGVAADGAELRERARAGTAEELLRGREEPAMTKPASIAWKVALALLLGAAVVFAAPVMGAHADADDNPLAGLTDARVAFDITAGDPGRSEEHTSELQSP